MGIPMAALAIILGLRIIAGEMDGRSLEIAYTVPGGCQRVWWAKLAAAALILVSAEILLALVTYFLFTKYPLVAAYGALQGAVFYLVLAMALATLFRSEVAAPWRRSRCSSSTSSYSATTASVPRRSGTRWRRPTGPGRVARHDRAEPDRHTPIHRSGRRPRVYARQPPRADAGWVRPVDRGECRRIRSGDPRDRPLVPRALRSTTVAPRMRRANPHSSLGGVPRRSDG